MSCQEWQGAKDRYGYGKVKRRGRTLKAHRVAYENAYGPIPDGMCVLHSCDNRACVAPDHLRLGTVEENNADTIAKGRISADDPRLKPRSW